MFLTVQFLTFGKEIYAEQPTLNSLNTWNRVEYRALEGFLVAYSPFNFTAIGGNLVGAPALMGMNVCGWICACLGLLFLFVGNVVLWKPSPMAMYSNYLVYQILREAGLPDGVVQFVPGDAEHFTRVRGSYLFLVPDIHIIYVQSTLLETQTSRVFILQEAQESLNTFGRTWVTTLNGTSLIRVLVRALLPSWLGFFTYVR